MSKIRSLSEHELETLPSKEQVRRFFERNPNVVFTSSDLKGYFSNTLDYTRPIRAARADGMHIVTRRTHPKSGLDPSEYVYRPGRCNECGHRGEG